MKLVEMIEGLKRDKLSEVIGARIKEFKKLGQKSSNEVFKELCFCFLTANFSAEGGIRIQKEINDGFINLPKEELAKKLSMLKHRFPNARAGFIVEARKYKDNLKEILSSFEDEKSARKWIVKNLKGIGMKEASHFLRNIGYKNVAIIDFHIMDLLVREGLIEKPKTLTENKYLEIEELLEKISKRTDLNLGELDLYLWYKETGKVLK